MPVSQLSGFRREAIFISHPAIALAAFTVESNYFFEAFLEAGYFLPERTYSWIEGRISIDASNRLDSCT